MACFAGALGFLSSCVAIPVASMASCLACQACTCVASSLCSCCCTSLFCSSKSEDIITRSSRTIYLVMFVVATVVAGILRDQSDMFQNIVNKADIVSVNMQCPSSDTSKDCMARALVLRICFGTFLFHIVLAMLTVGAKDFSNPRLLIHTGLWPLKFIVWAGLHLATFFMPTSFFLGFKWAVMVLAILFLIIQIIIFIEWIYEINESWINKDGAENLTGPYHILIIVIAIFCLIGSIVVTGFMFSWFASNSSGDTKPCGLFTFFTAFNLILFISLTLLSFRATAWMPSTGLLPSSLVAAFLTFKVLMALFAQNECNQLSANQGSSYGSPQAVSAVSIIIATLLAAYCSVALSQDIGEDGKFWGPNTNGEIRLDSLAPPEVHASPPIVANTQQDRSAPLLKNPHEAAFEMYSSQEAGMVTMPTAPSPPQANESAHVSSADIEAQDLKTPLSGPVGYSVAGFHIAFMLGICYVTMQLTDWNEDFSTASKSTTVITIFYS
jgi:serine incorporator 1/3